jgi:hypothetical protein
VVKRAFRPLVRVIDALDGFGDLAQAREELTQHLARLRAYVQEELQWYWDPEAISQAENALFLADSLESHLAHPTSQDWWVAEVLGLGYQLHQILDTLVKNRSQTSFCCYFQLDRLHQYLTALERGEVSSQDCWARLAPLALGLLDDLQCDLHAYRPALREEEIELLRAGLEQTRALLQASQTPSRQEFVAATQALVRMGEWATNLQSNQGRLDLDTLRAWRERGKELETDFEALRGLVLAQFFPQLQAWWAKTREELLLPPEAKEQSFAVLDALTSKTPGLETPEKLATLWEVLEHILRAFQTTALQLDYSLSTPLDTTIEIIGMVYQERLPARSLVQILRKFQMHNLTGVYAQVSQELSEFLADRQRDHLLSALEKLHRLRPQQFRRHQSLQNPAMLELFDAEEPLSSGGFDLQA